MLNKKKNNKGFTLVELLVVIAIIGILAVVAVPALLKNINKAKVADVESDYSSIKSAVLSYYADKNKMPAIGNLTSHMDSVPSEAAFDGDYDLDGTESLYLTITGANVTTEQLTKLTQEIGEGKVFVKSGDVDIAVDLEGDDADVDADAPSDLAGDNKIIKLTLIENTDM